MADTPNDCLLSDALARLIEHADAALPQRFRLPGGHAEPRAPGVIALVPDTPATDAAATIISVGLHGDETAPIELLGRVAARLDAGQWQLAAPALLIIGHADAIRAGRRYLDTNLNRLFRRDGVAADDPRQEAQRARVLMQAVDAFLAEHAAPSGAGLPGATDVPLHLDLHTAIRDSRYPRFAVEPCSDTPTPATVWPVLAGAGLQAALAQHRHSWTFSHYSRYYHGLAGFTLELGRVAPFGANDLDALEPMAALLQARLAGTPPATADTARLAFFRVEQELMRTSDDFTLAFAEDIANFTRFDSGELIAVDGIDGETRVGDVPLHVVFPNAGVERGARAALLARAVPAPGAPPAAT
ncbi:succinylglutamate desuccinylase [Kushneria sinocarnis]|uniref:Succinylglutamate desuccinylase n=1 Tax=Kushneria sinocarnis TaxID=595502 RepID=A0A420WZS9_9GAMM|nr:succinylglutamate desuccinylase [Kushneria sinocarnis]RKR06851.1 succinylglutamate desuccinylase [Kushneria sinocarnis]